MLNALYIPTLHARASLSMTATSPCSDGFGVTRQTINTRALAVRCAR